MVGDIGLCHNCLRWRPYGEPCTVCGGALEELFVADLTPEAASRSNPDRPATVREQFIQVLLAVQDLFEVEPLVKAAVNPLWQSMVSSKDLQNTALQLRGIAALHGISVGDGPGLGDEVTMQLDGEPWHVLRLPNGTITPIRKVGEPAAPTNLGQRFGPSEAEANVLQHGGQRVNTRAATKKPAVKR